LPRGISPEPVLIAELVRRVSKEENTDKRVGRRSILHPICVVSRTSLYNMVLILLSVIVAVTMIVVAISMMRHRISSGSLIRSRIAKHGLFIKGERSKQSATLSPSKAFLVVVLPDGTIVAPTVADQLYAPV
jgi:hypothetical protein